jgi:PAS domain S-box-containing protein
MLDASPSIAALGERSTVETSVAPNTKDRDRRAQALFDGIVDAVFVHDAEGRILDANPAACARLGYTREEFLRLTTRELDEPSFAAGFAERLRQQRASGQLTCEGRHLTKDGRVIPVDINTSVIEFGGKPAVLAVCRDISARKEAEKRQKALYAVTRVLAEATTVEEAANRILKAMGDALGWDVGAFWQVDDKVGVLRCLEVWHAAGFEALRFVEMTRNTAMARGVGLPGRAWASAAPAWITDVVSDANFPRAAIAAQEDLHGAFAFPIRAGEETLGAIEFFLHTPQAPDDDLLSMLMALGSQVGQFLERARVEEALRESEAFYHSLVENLPQNIIRKDREGRFTFVNQRGCATMGKPLAEIVGKTDFDLFPRELAEKYRVDDRQVLESGTPLQTVEEHRTATGQKLYVQIIKGPIYDAQGEKIGTQVMFWDVTERHQWEEALAESERRYRQLTEAALDGIIVTDEQGKITLFNPAAERIFGYAAAEAMGRALDDLVPPGAREGRQNETPQRALAHPGTDQRIGRPVEMRGKRRDGQEFPLELSLNMINLGGDVKYLATVRDLTERNRMRTALVQSEKMASIGLLSAGVAHEINNPLAYVGNNLAVLERDLKGLMGLLDHYEAHRDRLPPEVERRAREMADNLDLVYVRENLSRVLARTRDGVQRVARIVQSLRGLARTDRPRLESASLPELVDMSLEMVRGRLQRRSIRVEQDYQVTRICCVPAQIAQVLLNLLVNALQAIEAKSGEAGGVIRIASRVEGKELLLEVSDTGRGIEPRDLARLFDPFFTTKPVGEGTGLGLSITHGIVTGHGGRIEVDSKPGVGSRFFIYLPLEPSEQPHDLPDQALSARGG